MRISFCHAISRAKRRCNIDIRNFNLLFKCTMHNLST